MSDVEDLARLLYKEVREHASYVEPVEDEETLAGATTVDGEIWFEHLAEAILEGHYVIPKRWTLPKDKRVGA